MIIDIQSDATYQLRGKQQTIDPDRVKNFIQMHPRAQAVAFAMPSEEHPLRETGQMQEQILQTASSALAGQQDSNMVHQQVL